ncbi:hypothetical protein [Spirosoma panaciterrae]|uniref:hypothetical protein n=1 Tax=Spirosoma panaciterrae TaxID=496058 RepID=UPI00036305FD|nr:hypothetical protein [Spirosoma panaciterrae]
MHEPEFSWREETRANSVQQLAILVAILLYPGIACYRRTKRYMLPYLPKGFLKALYRLNQWRNRQFVFLFFPIHPMSHFDLEKQNYAQMSRPMLSKLLAILKPRSENPQTNWDKANAQTHVMAIKTELQIRPTQSNY